jgi:hypothetical protein
MHVCIPNIFRNHQTRVPACLRQKIKIFSSRGHNAAVNYCWMIILLIACFMRLHLAPLIVQ